MDTSSSQYLAGLPLDFDMVNLMRQFDEVLIAKRKNSMVQGFCWRCSRALNKKLKPLLKDRLGGNVGFSAALHTLSFEILEYYEYLIERARLRHRKYQPSIVL